MDDASQPALYWRAQPAGQAHIARARKLAQLAREKLEDPDLAYFVQGTAEFEAYIADMLWAQDYARANRDQMNDSPQDDPVRPGGRRGNRTPDLMRVMHAL